MSDARLYTETPVPPKTALPTLLLCASRLLRCEPSPAARRVQRRAEWLPVRGRPRQSLHLSPHPLFPGSPALRTCAPASRGIDGCPPEFSGSPQIARDSRSAIAQILPALPVGCTG